MSSKQEYPLDYAARSDNVSGALASGERRKPYAAVKTVIALRGGSILDSGISRQTPLMWPDPTGSPELI
jgi:hypothetical protein